MKSCKEKASDERFYPSKRGDRREVESPECNQKAAFQLLSCSEHCPKIKSSILAGPLVTLQKLWERSSKDNERPQERKPAEQGKKTDRALLPSERKADLTQQKSRERAKDRKIRLRRLEGSMIFLSC